LGSELEREVKKASAESEKAWAGAGQKVGLEIWRIEKFKVIAWPKEEYGKFYSGDSYILLSTREKPSDQPKTKIMKGGKWVEIDRALEWDIHFWLGQYTTQDEAGTAAYKTVELDTLLDDAPIQHREVQGFESDEFLKYFGGNICIMDGGVDSGFKHVKPEEYKTKLFHVKGTMKTCRVTQVNNEEDGPNGYSHKSLNAGDVFVLDAGLTIIQWNGQKSGLAERRKAAEFTKTLEGERNGRARTKVNEQGSEDSDFWDKLGGQGPVKSAEEGGSDDEVGQTKGGSMASKKFEKRLFRLSDASGSLKMTKEASGAAVNVNKLDSADVFILDCGNDCFVWIGKGTTDNEKKYGLQYAQDYLKAEGRPSQISITKINEGNENKVFRDSFK